MALKPEQRNGTELLSSHLKISLQDEFPLVTFHIFHPNPDPTSNLRNNLAVGPVVLAECCVFMFVALE